MRYSSAVVLSTLAIGQAAAANLRHASFHARRQAEAKREIEGVDWSNAAVYTGVDFNTLKYPGQPEATPAPAPEVKVANVDTVATPTPAPPPSSKVEESKPSETPKKEEDKKEDSPSGGVVGDLLQGVADVATGMGIQYTTDISKAKNIWVGDDSDWTTTFTNSASEPVVVFCWEKKPGDFTAMTLNKHKPAFNVGIKPNEKVTVAWAAGAFACAPAYGDTKMAQFGAVDNTWFEMNVHKGKATSVFNVSRNVNLNGNTITAVGSKCTSSMEKCFFKCMNGQVSCEFGYTLVGMNTDPGCHGDYDPVMKGDGGGCQMTDDSDHVDVNFSS